MLMTDHMESGLLDVILSGYLNYAVCTMFLTVGSTLGVLYLYRRYSQKRLHFQLRDLKRQKQLAAWDQVLEDIKDIEIQHLLEEFQNKNHTVQTFLDKLNQGQESPQTLLAYFVQQAKVSHDNFNCVNDVVTDCIERVKCADEMSSTILRGLPVSIKEIVPVKGYDQTLGGLLQYLHRPVEADHVLVEVLRKNGAVIHMRTNMCQLGLSPSCSNPLFGRTVNPLNPLRCCGGSSGGCAALIASGGSLLSIGTDIGGSVRIPAACCGVYSLKPTAGRLSTNSSSSNVRNPPNAILRPTCGPISCDLDGVVLLMQALCNEDMWKIDSEVPAMPFNHSIYNSDKKLVIGYYTTLRGYTYRSVPAVERAVLEAKSILEARGHILKPFPIPEIDESFLEFLLKPLCLDGGERILKLLKPQYILDADLRNVYYMSSLPRYVKWLLRLVAAPAEKELLRHTCGFSSVHSMWEWYGHRFRKNRRDFDLLMQTEGVDALIGPTMPFTALILKNTKRLSFFPMYTLLFNVLDYPAGTVPITRASREDVDELLRRQKTGEYPCDADHQLIVEDQTSSLGMPVSVQCITRKWQEELCLRVMCEIDSGNKDKV